MKKSQAASKSRTRADSSSDNGSSGVAPLRAAIVGAGLISDIHIIGLQRLPGVQVAAIVDSDRRRAAAKADQYGIPGVFTDQSEMLDQVRPDVVHILTPPFTHADLCAQAMRGGAHVYVEKPMAVSVEDCDRMIRVARETGRELCVGHCMVFDPFMQRALERIDSGELGQIINAAAVYAFDPARIPGYNGKGWYRDLPGGFVEDLASHPASLLLRVLGRPETVAGVVDHRPEHEGNEVAALISAPRGSGSMLISLGTRPEEVSLDIRGTRGAIRLNFSTMVMAVQKHRNIPKKLAHGVKNLEMASQLAVQTVTSTAQFLRGRLDTTKGIHSLIEAFYSAIREGRPAPVTGDEGRQVIAMLRELWPETGEEPRPRRWLLSTFEQPTPPTTPDGTKPMTALVTGATGFIGSHLVRFLTERGVRVRALARDPKRAQALVSPNVEVVIGDFGDPEVVQGLAEGVDVVFHLASVMRGKDWNEFQRVDVDGAANLIEESRRAGVKRIVFTSTLGAYALAELRDGAVVTEEMTDSPERVGHYSRAKLLVEQMLAEEQRAGRIETVVTRPGLVFGPGTSPYLPHMPHLGNLRGDRYVIFGDGRVTLALTYVENVVNALWLAATSPDAPGKTFTLVDDNLPTQRGFVEKLAELTGRPLRVTAIPRPGAFLIGAAVEGIAGAARIKPPTTRRLLLGKTTKIAFDTSRAKRVLGWRPDVAWEEGLQRAVEWAGEAQPESAPRPERRPAPLEGEQVPARKGTRRTPRPPAMR